MTKTREEISAILFNHDVPQEAINEILDAIFGVPTESFAQAESDPGDGDGDNGAGPRVYP